MKVHSLSGTLPALVTPFDSRDEIDEKALADMVKYHIDKGTDGFYLCGSTGQGILMNNEERQRVTEITANEVAGRVPVIVHVGAIVQKDAVNLAEHAAENGAAAISSIIPPMFTTLESITRYFADLGQATNLPLLPYLMGTALPPLDIMKGLSNIPAISGTKYTGPNMYELTQIITMERDPWWVFSGMDEQCVFAAMCGTSGAIGSSVNIMPGVYKRIRNLVAKDRQGEAFDLQTKANAIIAILISHGYAGALRAALGILGFSCGQPRPPELPFDTSHLREMVAEIEAADFAALTSI